MQKFCLDFFFIFLAHRANLSMSCSSPWGTSSGIGRETEKRRRRNKSSKLQIRTCRCGLTQINLPREETKAHSASFSPTQIEVQDLCIGYPKKKISDTATSKWTFFSLSQRRVKSVVTSKVFLLVLGDFVVDNDVEESVAVGGSGQVSKEDTRWDGGVRKTVAAERERERGNPTSVKSS